MEKIAVINLGSNTARLIIAEVSESGYFKVVDEVKESVRLGQDMTRDGGMLKPNRVAETLKVMKLFRTLCDSYKVDKIFAYATDAIRAAKNQKGFLDEVAVTCGIKLRILTQEEQAQLVYTGVINSMDVPKGLIVDIGGGSTQIIYYNRRNLLNQETLPFGAVTLTDLYKDSDMPQEERMKLITEFVEEHLQKLEWLKTMDPDTQLIGVGGSFRNLGRISRMMTNYPIEKVHNYRIPMAGFAAIVEKFKTLDVDKTTKIKGLSSGRADIFHAALASIQAVVDVTDFKEIVISGNGLREGVLFKYAVPATAEKPISDVLGYSINSVAYNIDPDNMMHVEQVYFLAMQLFKHLKVLHKLPRMYVKILKVAAILHDTGRAVKFYSYNKHSSYIIMNSKIYGLPHRDIIIAAYVAAARKKENFNVQDLVKYKDMLVEEDIAAISKLGVILRLAESFDRAMNGAIKGLTCDVLGDSVIMKTESDTDCSLEIRDALTCCDDFKKAFNKNLEIL